MRDHVCCKCALCVRRLLNRVLLRMPPKSVSCGQIMCEPARHNAENDENDRCGQASTRTTRSLRSRTWRAARHASTALAACARAGLTARAPSRLRPWFGAWGGCRPLPVREWGKSRFGGRDLRSRSTACSITCGGSSCSSAAHAQSRTECIEGTWAERGSRQKVELQLLLCRQAFLPCTRVVG